MVYKLEQNKNMKLTIPYYLHKAGAGFPSPATDYIEEDIGATALPRVDCSELARW